jgi:hypothetical protein
MSVAFIACVERGALEQQTVLLCRSLRRYGGRYARAPFYTFSPRRGHGPGKHTLAALAALGAEHRDEELNREYGDYGYGNKIFASAWAEEQIQADVLVFTDSDTVLTGEPTELDLPAGIDAAARPADSIYMNSTGPADPLDAYWRKVYDLFKLSREPFVETELGRRVRAYFSSGLIAVRRSAGLFRRWRDDFLRLVEADCLPESTGMSRMDEVSLAVTLARAFERVRILDGRYNYLIFKRPQLVPPWRDAQLEELVHVHYRRCFNVPGYLRAVRPPLEPASEIVRWLEQYLPLEPVASEQNVHDGPQSPGRENAFDVVSRMQQRRSRRDAGAE